MGNRFNKFWKEVKRRKVIRMLVIYLAVSFTILEATDIVIGIFDLPAWLMKLILSLLSFAFIISVILSWVYDFTPDGLKIHENVESEEQLKKGHRQPTSETNVWKAATYVSAVIIIIFISLQFTGGKEKQEYDLRDVKSIAILPFDNLSENPEQEYLVAGMHDALITEISHLSNLRVISRTSVLRYKDSDKSIPEIAKELNVNNIVEASVMESGDSIRIQVQLIEAAPDEKHLWAQSYDKSLQNIMTVHNEVVQSISREVNVTLTPQDGIRLANARQVNPESYKAYLRGMHHLNKGTPDGAKKGLELLHQSIEKDPAEPFGYAGLALAYTTLAHSPLAPKDARSMAIASAFRALELDPSLAEVHLAIAEIKLYMEWDFDEVEYGIKRALGLNPSLAMAHYHYAWALYLFGRMDEAIIEHKIARDLDPFNPKHTAWLGGLYLYDGRPDEAIQEALKSFEITPDYHVGYLVLGNSYLVKGMNEKAIATHRKLVELYPHWKWALANTYAMTGHKVEANKIVKQIENEELNGWNALGLMTVYGALGRMDEAFQMLAYEPHHAWVPWAAVMPIWEPLRADPRFEEFLEKLNLPDQYNSMNASLY